MASVSISCPSCSATEGERAYTQNVNNHILC
ncbi:IS1 family transposase, partial [Citrobacter portucalensis]